MASRPRSLDGPDPYKQAKYRASSNPLSLPTPSAGPCVRGMCGGMPGIYLGRWGPGRRAPAVQWMDQSSRRDLQPDLPDNPLRPTAHPATRGSSWRPQVHPRRSATLQCQPPAPCQVRTPHAPAPPAALAAWAAAPTQASLEFRASPTPPCPPCSMHNYAAQALPSATCQAASCSPACFPAPSDASLVGNGAHPVRSAGQARRPLFLPTSGGRTKG